MVEQENDSERESFAPSYELSTGEQEALTKRLLSVPEVANVPVSYRYVAVAVNGDNEFSNIGRNIERAVFDDAFGNDAEEMQKEYGPFEDASRFFISIDRQTGQPSGVLRVIRNSSVGLKTLRDSQGKPFFVDVDKAMLQPGMSDINKIQDVGTIAVPEEHRLREGPVSILLERAMYVDAQKSGIEALVSIIDHKPLTKLRSKWRGVGIPFDSLGDSKAGPYLGSKKSHAVHGYVPEFYEKMNRHRNSLRGHILSRFVLGDALERLVAGSHDEAIVLNPSL